MSGDRRKVPTRSPRERTGRGGSSDPVADRLDAIEARLSALTPEPLPVGAEFVAGQLEQCRLLRDALDETIARLESELTEAQKAEG